MEAIAEIIQSSDFWKIALPALAAVFAWYFNERSKLVWEQYKRKEENYKELLRCLKGFYVATQDQELKGQFLHQVNLLWLYAPDEVLGAAYEFLRSVKTGASASPEERDLACGALVAAARKDLLSRNVVSNTVLSAKEFGHFHAN